jgi:hypothetical protein
MHAQPSTSEVTVSEQADQPAAPDGADQLDQGNGIAVRKDLHSEPLPEPEEGLEVIVRQGLGHCRHRQAGEAGPGTCQIPISAVRQGDDRPGGGMCCPKRQLAIGRDAGHYPSGRPRWQGEHFVEVA